MKRFLVFSVPFICAYLARKAVIGLPYGLLNPEWYVDFTLGIGFVDPHEDSE